MNTPPVTAAASYPVTMPVPTVESVWRSYWLPLLTDGGAHPPILDHIKAELFDAFLLVDRARAVYQHVTGGASDDLAAPASFICELADRRVERMRG